MRMRRTGGEGGGLGAVPQNAAQGVGCRLLRNGWRIKGLALGVEQQGVAPLHTRIAEVGTGTVSLTGTGNGDFFPKKARLIPYALSDSSSGTDCAGAQAMAATGRGTAWHLAFGTLIAWPYPDAAAQATALRDLLAAYGLPDLHFERPIQIDQPDGAPLNGGIDLPAKGRDGPDIIDHNIAPGTFDTCSPQLATYARAATVAPRRPVRRLAPPWMTAGMLEMLEMPYGR